MCINAKAAFQIDFLDDQGQARQATQLSDWPISGEHDLHRRIRVMTDALERLGCEVIQISRIESAPMALDMPDRRSKPALSLVQARAA